MPPRRSQSLDHKTFQDSFQESKADYSASKQTPYRRQRTGILTTGSSADWHYRVQSDYLRIAEIARDMDRNDSIIGQGVDRAVANTIQDGFMLDPKTGDRQLDKALSARWKDWSEDPDQCDIMGEFAFNDFERFVLRHVFIDGDIVGIPTIEGSLQMFESHRIRTPQNTRKDVVHGFLLDDRRKRLECWVTKDDISPYVALNLVGETQPYQVRDEDGDRMLFHVYNPKRVSQTRGVSALAPVFDTCGMHEDIQFAKMVQQQIVSCFTYIIERGDNYTGDDVAPTGEQTVQPLSDGTTRTLQGIAPGMSYRGKPGEKVKGFSPKVPNAEFFAHVRMMLMQIGINLGLPLSLFLLDASDTNFSGFRGAVDQARMGFRANQRWLMRRWHIPIYHYKVKQWIAEEPALQRASANPQLKIYAHHWNPPTWPYIEPLKDASADLLRVRNNLISHRRLHAERGRVFRDIVRENVEDNASAIRRAKKRVAELNAEFPGDDPVHWRELLSLPTAAGVTVQITAEDDPSPAPQKGAKNDAAA